MQIERTPQFDKDVKLAEQQGKDLSILEDVSRRLAAGDETIESDYNIYPCGGGFTRLYNTLFLQPDWVVVYKLTKDELYFARTGSPSVAP